MGRKSGSASSITTSEPRRPQTLPSSSPITPAPITPKRAGTLSNSSAPVESTIKSSVNGVGAMSTGTDPGASTTCAASSTCGSPSWGTNSTCLGPGCAANSLPWPASAVTPLPSKSPPMPAVSLATTPSLCAIIAGMSRVNGPVPMPSVSSPSCASTYLCEASSSALDGMQPQFRHVPPSVGVPSLVTDLSMHAVRMPNWAARIAAA